MLTIPLDECPGRKNSFGGSVSSERCSNAK